MSNLRLEPQKSRISKCANVKNRFSQAKTHILVLSIKKNTEPLPPQTQKSAVNIDHVGQLNVALRFTAARFIFWSREQWRVEGRLEESSLKYSCPQLLLRLLPGKCDAEISMQSFCPLNMAPAACDKPQWTEQSLIRLTETGNDGSSLLCAWKCRETIEKRGTKLTAAKPLFSVYEGICDHIREHFLPVSLFLIYPLPENLQKQVNKFSLKKYI